VKRRDKLHLKRRLKVAVQLDNFIIIMSQNTTFALLYEENSPSLCFLFENFRVWTADRPPFL